MDMLWPNFPQGLKVLLVDDDAGHATHSAKVLESHKFCVTTASNAKEARGMVGAGASNFDIAIVELCLKSGQNDAFDMLSELKCSIPVLVCCEEERSSLVMKAIAAGAEDILQKPLSSEKCELIWQHTIRRRASERPSSPPPPAVVAVPEGKDYPTSSDEGGKTPRSVLHMDRRSSRESTATTSSDFSMLSKRSRSDFDDDTSPFDADGLLFSMDDDDIHLEGLEDLEAALSSKPAGQVEGEEGKGKARKKLKVDWTPELHRKFVAAVEKLGVDKAIPSRILELMGEMGHGLTRHHIASHLQKYRCHKKHQQLRDSGTSSQPGSWKVPCMPGGGRGGPMAMHMPMGMGGPMPPQQLHVWGHPATPAMMQNPSTPPIMGVPVCVPQQVAGSYVPIRTESTPGFMHPTVPIAAAAAAAAAAIPVFPIPPKEVMSAALREGKTSPGSMVLGLKSPNMDAIISEAEKAAFSAICV